MLTTTEFAARLEALGALGVTVEVLDEPELRDLGMRTLLAVGEGSETPPPLEGRRHALGRGRQGGPRLRFSARVWCRHPGASSLKPAQGMEDMTMDMGGAGNRRRA